MAKSIKAARSASTGKFVTKKYAEKNPSKTVVETSKKATPKKKS